MSSQLKNLLILAGALVLAVLVIVWIQFVNKGNLVVEANAPFNVRIAPVEGSRECLAGKCSYAIKPGEYDITFSKPEHFEGSYKAVIRRFSDTNLQHQFQKIPKVNLVGELKLPEFEHSEIDNNVEDVKLTLNEEVVAVLNEHAEGYDEVIISPFSEDALLRKGENYSIVRNVEHGPSEILDATIAVWSQDASLFAITTDEETKKQIFLGPIGQAGEGTGQGTIITSFISPLNNPQIYAGNNWEVAIVTDEDEKQTKVYLIDLKKKSKERIMELPNLAGWKWSPDGRRAVYQVNSEVDELPVIFVYSRDSNSSRQTRIPVGLKLIEWISNDEIAVVSNEITQDYVTGSDGNDLDGLSRRFRLAGEGVNVIDNDIILAYDVADDSWRNLTQYNAFSLRISDLTVTDDKKKIRILSEGVIYELEIF